MPETGTSTLPQMETPGEKTIRRYYEGRLAARLMHVASMEQNRAMLRRGARKMQEGTLGQPGEPIEEEPVNISIGDVIQYLPQAAAESMVAQLPATPVTAPAPATPATAATPLWQRAALTAALLASGAGAGAGVPWLLGAFDKAPAAAVQPTPQGVDADTWFDLRLSPPIQEPAP